MSLEPRIHTKTCSPAFKTGGTASFFQYFGNLLFLIVTLMRCVTGLIKSLDIYYDKKMIKLYTSFAIEYSHLMMHVIPTSLNY